MLGLSEIKYTTVFLKFEKIKPWIVNRNSVAQILSNASFLKRLCEERLTATPTTRALVLNSYDTDCPSTLILDECLKYLGMKSMSSNSEPFLSPQSYAHFRNSSDMALLSEKYMFPNVDSFGAGRHVLLKSAQLKSVGRNPLCVNEDYFHSWGGMVIPDAIKAYVNACYIDARAKLPSLEHLGVFTYDALIAGGVRGAVILRDSKTFRLGQLFPNTLNPSELETVRSHLINYFSHDDPARMLDTIMDNYVHAYSVGIRYESLSPDNLLVDGRWIDTESVNLQLDKSSHDAWIQFSIEGEEKNLFVEKFRSLSSYSNESNLIFRDSWIHRLFLMVQATHFVYQGLWNDFHYDLEGKFQACLNKYFGAIDLEPWFSLLKDYDSRLIYRFSIPRKKWSDVNVDWKNVGPLKLSGYYYDVLEKVHVLTFGNDEVSSQDVMTKLVDRWQKLFSPYHQDWEHAFQLSAEIKRISSL